MPGAGQRPLLGDLLLSPCVCVCVCICVYFVTCAATMTLVVLADTDWVLTPSQAQ